MYTAADLEAVNEDLTAQAMEQVDSIIDNHRDKPGCLILVLQECQEVVGYLPVELQEYISEGLNIPGSMVFGVVTFYSFFSMVPRGRHTVKVCLGTACYVKGSAQVLQSVKSSFDLEEGGTSEDRRFSLEVIRCFGACGLAPVIVVDNDTYGQVNAQSVLKILEDYE